MTLLPVAIVLGLLLWGLSLLYLSGGFRRRQTYDLSGLTATDPNYLVKLASLSDSLTTRGQVRQFLTVIDDIQTRRLQLINQATQRVQFETFIITPGQRANALQVCLCRQAAQGVTVQVLADGYGAKSMPASYWRRLRAAGVEVRWFNSFSWRSPLDYLQRNHRKLLVVDRQLAMVGGAGISDLWDGQDQYDAPIPWYDFEVEWEGPVVDFLTGFFDQHWLEAGGIVNLNDDPPAAAPSAAEIASGAVLITPGEDPSRGDSPIRSLFQLCMASAQQRLWIASPYLLPDRTTIELLIAAQQRGVDVRLLTMGPKSDKPYVYYVARERYRPLLLQNIGLYEYQPSMMHAKVMLIDHHWVSLGSANLDPRSFFHNDELHLCANPPPLLDQVEHFFKQGFDRSRPIHLSRWQHRPWSQRLAGILGNLLYWQL